MTKKIINNNLSKVIQICHEMLELADHGDKFRDDTGCGVVYGTLRDSAYKIRQLAQKELDDHNEPICLVPKCRRNCNLIKQLTTKGEL